MRIVYIHQYFKNPTKDGAGSSRTYEMARRLSNAGHDVHIVTSDTTSSGSTGGEWVTESVDGLTVHWCPVPYSNLMEFRTRIHSFIKFALRSSVRARKLRGDVVFATSTPLTIAIPGILASLFRKSPFVFEVRDLWPDVPIAMGALSNPILRAIARSMEKVAYSRAHSIVALSSDMKAGIVAKGVIPDKVTVIPNASDIEFFEGHDDSGKQWRQSHDWLQDRPMVLYCGTLGKVNAVQYLVEVADHTRRLDSEIRFVVVGNGNEEGNVRELAAQRGVLDESFFMLPRVPKMSVPAIFAAASVSTSTVAPITELFANSANKIFDSFAAGCPVLINHGGWQAKLLEDSGAGWVMDMHDPSAAALRLVAYLDDPQALEDGRTAAKALAVNQFSRDSLALELRNVLESAYASGKLGRRGL